MAGGRFPMQADPGGAGAAPGFGSGAPKRIGYEACCTEDAGSPWQGYLRCAQAARSPMESAAPCVKGEREPVDNGACQPVGA